MAGRFGLLADVHVPKAAVKALAAEGWQVERVVDVLGQETPDEDIFEYAARNRLVIVTSDERAQGRVWQWVREGRSLPGMIVWAQKQRRVVSVGGFLRFVEGLAQEDEPFAVKIRHVRPEQS